MSQYEFWLIEDTGARLALLNPTGGPSISFFDYSRSLQGLGTLHFGMPYADYISIVPWAWKPDRMVDVWRSPGEDYEMRREGVYFLRKYNVYTRKQDNMMMIEFWGRDLKDLINRRHVCQDDETSYTRKSGPIDDIMKSIVRDQMLYGYAVDMDGLVDYDRAWPQGEFTVEGNLGLGPNVTDPISVVDKNVLDEMKALRDLSLQLNKVSSANRKIYFDVVPGMSLDWNRIWILEEAPAFEAILDESGDELLDETSLAAITAKDMPFQFQTFADLRGKDRTSGIVFSIPNGNLSEPSLAIDHLDEANTIIMRGSGQGASRVTLEVQDAEAATLSRWARVETLGTASSETTDDALESAGQTQLVQSRKQEIFDVAFLNSPGGEDVPRSLYGIDWDLGDMLPVHYAGFSLDREVVIVYVSMNDKGVENISGRTATNE